MKTSIRSESGILAVLDSGTRRLPEPFVVIKTPMELNDGFADILRKTVFASGSAQAPETTIHGWDYTVAFGPGSTQSVEVSRATALRIKREYDFTEIFTGDSDTPGIIWGNPDGSFFSTFEGFYSGRTRLHREKVLHLSAPKIPARKKTAAIPAPATVRRRKTDPNADYPRLF